MPRKHCLDRETAVRQAKTEQARADEEIKEDLIKPLTEFKKKSAELRDISKQLDVKDATLNSKTASSNDPDFKTAIASLQIMVDQRKNSEERRELARMLPALTDKARLYEIAQKEQRKCPCCNGGRTHMDIERGTEGPETETYYCTTCEGTGEIDVGNS